MSSKKIINLKFKKYINFKPLEYEEILSEDDIVILFRKRNVITGNYTDYVERVFPANKEPSIEELKEFTINSLELKFKPEEIIQTPPKKLKYHDTNVIIYNIPKIEDDNSFFIPEPEKKRNYEKYDKLRCEPSKGDYQ